jgi:hypothetical protein
MNGSDLPLFARDLARDTRVFVDERIKTSEEKLDVAALNAIDRALAPLMARIDKFEAQRAELQARPRGLKYAGVWTSAQAPYSEGDVVSEKGGMWIATAPTRRRPGESRDWQLAVKSGRDGRDLR